MTKPTQGSALLRLAFRSKRVDLYHVTKGVGFVPVVRLCRILCWSDIKPFVLIQAIIGLPPVIVGSTGNTVPGILPRTLRQWVVEREVVVPVLFRCQIRTPRCRPHGAIVQGTAGLGTVQAVGRYQLVVAASGATNIHGRRSGNPAVVPAVFYQIPLAGSIFSDMNN